MTTSPLKKNIAIVAGGDSSEVIVSLKSASGIYSFMDKSLYKPYIITIVGKKWQVEISEHEQIDMDKNDFSFIQNGTKITFDFAYITIHGTPGENGILQGYFDLIGLPYSCCGVLAAAVTFNKFTCNHYLKGFGIKVSESLVLRKGQSISSDEVISKIGLPCFVKPNVGGSSFGVTKVKTREQIEPAIALAFSEGNEVLIEAYLAGTEITCGIYKTRIKSQILPVTEVVSQNEFFDFDAKYKGQVEEITPARISAELTERVQKLTSTIYDILGCKGIVRIDYIITEGVEINLLEVNTTPGMTPTSFIPQQIAAAGLDIKHVMTEIIENELAI
ncbi:MAG: D-alanine--D-alanine ligase A [Porphyromonadaceae bacterium CG2_30_38_12]|nr:MAG: D-alanine--D-alanine ligase A [Porphyromonadaceae bacterium CG2_30_38_12]